MHYYDPTHIFANIVYIFYLGWMIEYFAPNSRVSLTEAYLYGTGVVFMACIYTFTHHPYFFGVMYTGMKMRIACCSLLYRKVEEEVQIQN